VKKGVIHKPYYLEIYDVIPSRCLSLVVAFEMRKRGFSFQAIGDFHNVSKQAAQHMIRKYEKILIEKGFDALKDRKHKKRKDAKVSQEIS
jgi:predicted DNA-binding protein YlxM (UPF0122 family)